VRIGISTSGPRQAEVVRAALELDVFTSVQSTWNVLEPSVGPALAEAHDAGWFVVVKEAMANGRLATEAGPLAPASAATGVGRDALALAVVLAQPWADVVLSGAATVTQLQQNLAALTGGTATADAVLDELAGVAEPAESYWRSRSELAWT
jgi:aryl-alcohol dehydrogenase-like predicted oxidoreductase